MHACHLPGGLNPVSLQVTLRYNMPPPPSAGTFDLSVETEPKTCTSDASTHFRLLLRARYGLGSPRGFGGGQTAPSLNARLCLSFSRYTGNRAATNMVVIEAKLPSGYIPDKSSVVEVRGPCCPSAHWDPARGQRVAHMVLSPALPIPQLKRQKLVKKVEVQSDQVTIYLDQVRWVAIAAVLRAQG